MKIGIWSRLQHGIEQLQRNDPQLLAILSIAMALLLGLMALQIRSLMKRKPTTPESLSRGSPPEEPKAATSQMPASTMSDAPNAIIAEEANPQATRPASVEAEPAPRGLWKYVGASVRGASHDRSGLPNQDAMTCWPTSQQGPPMILAVADGHGNSKAFRSNVGSQLAVDSAVTVLQEFIQAESETQEYVTSCKRAVEERLAEMLDRHWKKSVERHLQENPLLLHEIQGVETKEGAAAREKVEKKEMLAYGSTLLAVLLTQHFVIGVQIGDGEMLVVTETGEVVQPIPGDSRLFGNETTSLSDSQAWKNFRVCFQTLEGAAPALILLCTDGYANAMERSYLEKACGEFLDSLQEVGTDEVRKYLPELLTKCSTRGSGDDVTLGLLWRTDAPLMARSEEDRPKAIETETTKAPASESTPFVATRSEAEPRSQ